MAFNTCFRPSIKHFSQTSLIMISVLQIGMGPLGVKMVDYISQRNNFQIVGAVDLNPELHGRSLAELSAKANPNVRIQASIDKALAQAEQAPVVALLTTVSDMERITPQIEEILSHSIPVVSTCEELSFPWQEDKNMAERIDQAAKKAAVGVVGTGVNPGFLMDALPSFLTSACQEVTAIQVRRFQDASQRRLPFQNKIGAGLSLAAFQAKKDAGTLRHVGLTQSIQFLADKMGWTLDKVEDIISPVMAQDTIQTPALSIPEGHAAGVCQIGKGWVKGEVKIVLEFQAAVGEAASYDEVCINGTPNLVSRIEGGVNGDLATCAITINTIGSLLKAFPGLHTMGTLPATSFFQA